MSTPNAPPDDRFSLVRPAGRYLLWRWRVGEWQAVMTGDDLNMLRRVQDVEGGLILRRGIRPEETDIPSFS